MLPSVVSRSVQSPSSSFYRDLYRGIDINAVRSLEELPFLTRERITQIPPWQRTFVPPEDVHFIRNTYGTSGKHIIITPRIMYGSYASLYDISPIRRMVSLFASAHVGFPQQALGIQTIFADVKNLSASAALITAFCPDALYALPYSALLLGERLPCSLRGGISLLQLTGERCSAIQYKNLQKLYPNARIASVYSASETREIVGEPCVVSHTPEHLLIHEIPSFHFEIIEPDSGRSITQTGVAGELVLTTLEERLPFPLIRYRTGDLVQYLSCACGRGRGYEILGRVDVYPIKVMRGEINLPAVEAVLSEFDSYLHHTAEVHYFDAMHEHIAKAQMKVCLYPKDNAIMPENFNELVAERFQMFPSYSYAQGVRDGFYAPLCVEMRLHHKDAGKLAPVRFIRHT